MLKINNLNFKKPKISGSRSKNKITINLDSNDINIKNKDIVGVIYVKNISKHNYFKNEKYENLGNFKINKKTKLIIKNSFSKMNSNHQIFSHNFKDSDHVFIRIVYKVNDIEINNFDEINFKKTKIDSSNEINLPFYVKKPMDENDIIYFNFNFLNVPPDTSTIFLLKRSFSRGENKNKKFDYVFDKKTNKIIKATVNNKNESIETLFDNRLEEFKVYQYKLELLMNNGTRIRTQNIVSEKYFRRQNSIK